jgi:hypothetical protein
MYGRAVRLRTEVGGEEEHDAKYLFVVTQFATE